MDFKIVFSIIVTTVAFASFVSGLENNVTEADDFDGETLVELGRKLNKPMLTVVGMAVRNLQKLHPCDDWTQWSACKASRIGHISTRTRNRKCAIGNGLRVEGKTRNETDISICEGKCPNDYNVTTHGFCLKLYTVKKTHDEAEKQCFSDGGFIINIDSETKFEAVKAVLSGFSDYVHIDGRRKDANSAWMFSYGSQEGFFKKWGSSEPGTADTRLTLVANSFLWYGKSGTSGRSFLCEVVIDNE